VVGQIAASELKSQQKKCSIFKGCVILQGKFFHNINLEVVNSLFNKLQKNKTSKIRHIALQVGKIKKIRANDLDLRYKLS
jgi:hypothetical protein